jgi:hypothetical protein
MEKLNVTYKKMQFPFNLFMLPSMVGWSEWNGRKWKCLWATSVLNNFSLLFSLAFKGFSLFWIFLHPRLLCMLHTNVFIEIIIITVASVTCFRAIKNTFWLRRKILLTPNETRTMNAWNNNSNSDGVLLKFVELWKFHAFFFLL